MLDKYPRTKRSENGAPFAFLQQHVNYPWEKCVLWPFAKALNGYPELRFEGRSTRAHRLMCILAHGEPPEPYYEASHTCENGHLGCVNPRHLVWETHAENHARRAGRKTRRKTHPDMILG
jgi:hypothetical protein